MVAVPLLQQRGRQQQVVRAALHPHVREHVRRRDVEHPQHDRAEGVPHRGDDEQRAEEQPRPARAPEFEPPFLHLVDGRSFVQDERAQEEAAHEAVEAGGQIETAEQIAERLVGRGEVGSPPIEAAPHEERAARREDGEQQRAAAGVYREPPRLGHRGCDGVREERGDDALLERVHQEEGGRDERDAVAEPLEQALHHSVLLGEEAARLHDPTVLDLS